MSRRKLSYILRPSLPRRAVVWFPRFADSQAIDRFRCAHDPLGNIMPAHLTLVFPFHSRLTLDQLSAHVQKVIRAWPAFPVVLSGLWSAQSEWIGLATLVGREALIEMHDRLYRGVLAEFLRSDLDYEPHVTIGRARTSEEFERLTQLAGPVARRNYRSLLNELTILRLDGENDWQRERQLSLGW